METTSSPPPPRAAPRAVKLTLNVRPGGPTHTFIIHHDYLTEQDPLQPDSAATLAFSTFYISRVHTKEQESLLFLLLKNNLKLSTECETTTAVTFTLWGTYSPI